MSSVETADLEQIVLTVRREYDRLRGGHKLFRLRSFHRLAFLLLRFVAYSVPVALILLLLADQVSNWVGSETAVVSYIFSGTTLGLGLWLFLSVLLLPVLILLNLPLVVAAWRQRRPIVKRDLLEPILPAWQRKARWAVLGLALVTAVLVVTVQALDWSALVLVLIVVVLPFLLLMLQSFLRLVKRNLDLLRSVEELQGVLEEKLQDARRLSTATVELPHSIAVKLSETAQGFLHNERLRAIDDSLHREPTVYSISQSGSYRKSLQALEPEARLRLSDQIQALSEEQKPPGAKHDEQSGNWVWPLHDLSAELIYQIDDDQRQVMVREIRPATPDEEAEADGPG